MTAGPFDGFIKKRPDCWLFLDNHREISLTKKQKSIYKLAEHYYYVL